MPAFEELGLCPEILETLEEIEWFLPTDIQDEAIPLILGGGDVLAAAETGSGKTGAFVLPILQIVHETQLASHNTCSSSKTNTHVNKKKSNNIDHSRRMAEKLAKLENQSILWNANDRDSLIALSPENPLLCQCRDLKKWCGVRANVGVKPRSPGNHSPALKFYYECSVKDEGIVRLGWASKNANYDLGKDAHGFGFGATGTKSHKRDFSSYGEPFTKGDVIGCFLDFSTSSIHFSKNGVHFEQAFSLPKTFSDALYPIVAMKNAEVEVNFGKNGFSFPPGNGFRSLHDAQYNEVEVSRLVEEENGAPPILEKNRTTNQPLAIILEPSRELAEQVFESISNLKKYINHPPIQHAFCVGGYKIKDQIAELKKGCQIVVATPGRLEELVKMGVIDISLVKFFILDEVDRLIETDQTKLMKSLYEKMETKNHAGLSRLQVCFFSATLHAPEIKLLADEICHHPVWVDLKGVDTVPETVVHVAVPVDPRIPEWSSNLIEFPPTDEVHIGLTGVSACANLIKTVLKKHKKCTPEELSAALKVLKPHVLIRVLQHFNMEQVIIFCRTNLDCELLEQYLKVMGSGTGRESVFSCAVVAGMRSTENRKEALRAFKDSEVRCLICTDVAARGIDVKGLPFVINLTLPDSVANYIHRIGRVGRSGCKGLAVSIVSGGNIKEKVWYHKSCRRASQPKRKQKHSSCKNRELLKDGGCTTWYDEPGLIAAIEHKLGVEIATLDHTLKLPQSLLLNVSEMGESKAEDPPMSSAHLEELEPRIRILAELETSVQYSWLETNRLLE